MDRPWATGQLVCIRCGAWFAPDVERCPLDGTPLVKPQTLVELAEHLDDRRNSGVETLVEVLICASCGARHPVRTERCPRDGTPLVLPETLVELLSSRPEQAAASPPRSAPGELICVSCKVTYPSYLRRCPRDGTPLVRPEITKLDQLSNDSAVIDPASRVRRPREAVEPSAVAAKMQPTVNATPQPTVLDPATDPAIPDLDEAPTLKELLGRRSQPASGPPTHAAVPLRPLDSGLVTAVRPIHDAPTVADPRQLTTAVPATEHLLRSDGAALAPPTPGAQRIGWILRRHLATIGLASAALLVVVGTVIWLLSALDPYHQPMAIRNVASPKAADAASNAPTAASDLGDPEQSLAVGSARDVAVGNAADGRDAGRTAAPVDAQRDPQRVQLRPPRPHSTHRPGALPRPTDPDLGEGAPPARFIPPGLVKDPFHQ